MSNTPQSPKRFPTATSNLTQDHETAAKPKINSPNSYRIMTANSDGKCWK